MRLIVIFLSNILLIFCFPLEDVNLCKRKPYLIFCKEQNVGFFESRQQNPEVLDDSERRFKASENPDQSPLERPLLSAKERETEVEDGATPAGRKEKLKPIDLSRPNAEDVAREMGELQRDDPTTTTESNEVEEKTSSSAPIKQRN
uniref:Uncharacterized protein n=1 Tax=Panagrolaimus sp. ES5 TaxID=591445 RepID=A0AC34GTS6_9BILA